MVTMHELSEPHVMPDTAQESRQLIEHHEQSMKAAFNDSRLISIQNEGESIINCLRRLDVHMGHSEDYRWAKSRKTQNMLNQYIYYISGTCTCISILYNLYHSLEYYCHFEKKMYLKLNLFNLKCTGEKKLVLLGRTTKTNKNWKTIKILWKKTSPPCQFGSFHVICIYLCCFKQFFYIPYYMYNQFKCFHFL